MPASIEELRQLARMADERGDRETATKAMQKIVEMQQVNAPRDYAETARAGATRGLLNLAGLPAETLRNLANLGIAGYGSAVTALGYPEMAPPVLRPTDVPGTPAWLQQKAEQYLPGSTTYGEQQHPYISKAAEFGSQGIALGPSAGASAIRSGLYGVASGAGSEAGGQLAEKQFGPQYRSVGELAGAITAPAALGLSEGTARFLANQRPASKVAMAYRAGQEAPQNRLAESQFRDIQAQTGQRALLGQRMPGSEIRSLESLTAKDAASLQKLHVMEQNNIQKSMDLLDKATRQGSRFGTDVVAGRTLRRVVNNTRKNIVDTMNKTADIMFGGLRKKVVMSGMGTRQFVQYPNARKVFNQFINTAKDNGATKAHLRNLLAQRDRYFGQSDIASAMKSRQLINRAARGDINLFSGSRILTKQDSMDLAKSLARASEIDMENSIKNTFGDSSTIYSDWRKANNVYRDNINKLESFDNTVLGKMIGKPVSNVTDFSQKFLSLKPEEKARTLNMLGQNQKQAIAKYQLDQARQSSIDLSGKGTAGERFTLPSGEQVNMNPTKFLESIGDRKQFVSLFPKEQRVNVDKILKGFERQADRLSTTGGSANELSRQQSYVGSAVGGAAGNKQSAIFLARQLYADIFRGRLSDLLFTEKGQQAVLKRLQKIESRKSIPKQVQLTGAIAANKGQ